MRSSVFVAALALFLAASLDARAEWKAMKKAPPGLTCQTDLFGSLPRPYLWQNGGTIFAICTATPLPPKMPVSLAANFQLLLVVGDQQTELATETAVMAKPRRVRIQGDDVEITKFFSGNGGPSLMREVIHCEGGTCERQAPTCALDPPKGGKANVGVLERKLSAARPEQKLTVWKDWFFDGKHLKEGWTVIVEAMLGDSRAAELVTGDVSADGGPGEWQAQLSDDIEEVSKICSLAK